MPLLLLLFLILSLSLTTSSSSSTTYTFIFGGCSQAKYSPGTAYESATNSLLASLVNAAIFSSYNNFTIPTQDNTAAATPPLYGLFQCRGDLPASDCSRCVARAVSQLGTLCPGACGGALQLDGCFVKYDNSTFLGVEDKTLVLKKCGPSIGLTSDALTRRDAVLAYLGTSGEGTFRRSGSGDLQGVAQCVGDLSVSECEDCLSDAIGRLRTECGPVQWGQVYLAKCYARYSEGGDYSRDGKDDNKKKDDELQKTLALIVGLIAGVALLIIFISFLTKLCDKHKDGK